MVQSDAERLSAGVGGALLEARRLASLAVGAHGRRRAGQGEGFWQYREHLPEDGARLVDWRRSARGDKLFVREREREAAQSLSLWIDPHPGFAWRSDETLPMKAQRAQVLCLALAIAFARGGERVGLLGGPMRRGSRAGDYLAEDLLAPQSSEPPAPPSRGAAIYASDFFAGPEAWRARLARAAAADCRGALILVSDPAEEDFPYAGRTQFRDPAGGKSHVLIGRAEHARDAFAQRLKAHRAQMHDLARGFGFLFFAHRTDHTPAPTFSAVLAALAGHGG
ncbi:MAG: DUF58 domain-containing protein [Alphaproteobacteria bacterium]|nr:DUF58 domain-containing protein [Alphaproteobacteria bacterium]